MCGKLKYVVYKITFPNGKIYVGSDTGGMGHTLRYFGSWDCCLVEKDFSKDELMDFSIRKQILYESANSSVVRKKESEFIVKLGANDPAKGYNRNPRC